MRTHIVSDPSLDFVAPPPPSVPRYWQSLDVIGMTIGVLRGLGEGPPFYEPIMSAGWEGLLTAFNLPRSISV